MRARLADEEKQATNDSSILLARKRGQIESIRLKIDRLVEMRLNGEIGTETYNEQKAKLMSQKKTFEEEALGINRGQLPWLEPLRNWILDAKNLNKIAESGALSEKRELARKVFGSNLFLSRKKARGEAVKPWAFLADNLLSHDVEPPPRIEPGTSTLRKYCSTN